MPAKTSPATASRRQLMKDVYLMTFDSFGTDVPELSEFIGEPPTKIRSLLKSLGSLVTSMKVNDDKHLTWQCVTTYDDIDRDAAIKLFNERFPEEVASKPAKTGGATGPRYTPEQIKAGLAARKAGMKNADVAAAAGVKSPSYFAKTLKLIEHQATVKKVAAKKRTAAKRSAKTSTPAAK